MKGMKLNYKRVILVGIAFFIIQLFWQTYDTIIPKILNDKFGMSQFLSGIMMSLDNLLALVLLPLFGSISDRTKSRMGRRKPFVLVGTIVACVLFVSLTFADGLQIKNINDSINARFDVVLSGEDTEERRGVLGILYDENCANVQNTYEPKLPGASVANKVTRDNFVLAGNTVLTPERLEELTSALDRTEAEITQHMEKLRDFYTNLIVEARQDYAWRMTVSNPLPLILFIGLLFMLLMAMSVFRSPAVALMPDITPKPLRSKANAVINMMSAGAIALVIILGMVFGTGKPENTLMNYFPFFLTIACIMAGSLVVFMLTVKEKQWVHDADLLNEQYNVTNEEEEELARQHKRHLTKGELRSLIFLLLSVAFWFIGYNSVQSKYSIYASDVLGLDYNSAFLIGGAMTLVSFLPIAVVSSKLGRKRTILIGIGMLFVSFLSLSFFGKTSPVWLINVAFGLSGIGWTAISINSFPMVVELATGSDVGRYTGFYYSASMAAQIVAPVLGGVFMDIKKEFLFPFATVFVVLSFITMTFVKHGDSKPVPKKDLLENFGDGD